MLFNGKTLGKALFKLRVIKYNGTLLDFSSCVLRNFIKLLEVLLTCTLSAVVTIIINKDFRTIGDLVANTVVVLEPKSKIAVPDFSLKKESEEETSAGSRLVRKLSEDDLYVIRSFLNSMDKFDETKQKDISEKLALTIKEKLNDTADISDPVEYLKNIYLRHKDG
jgi:hypothetical protein